MCQTEAKYCVKVKQGKVALNYLKLCSGKKTEGMENKKMTILFKSGLPYWYPIMISGNLPSTGGSRVLNDGISRRRSSVAISADARNCKRQEM